MGGLRDPAGKKLKLISCLLELRGYRDRVSQSIHAPSFHRFECGVPVQVHPVATGNRVPITVQLIMWRSRNCGRLYA